MISDTADRIVQSSFPALTIALVMANALMSPASANQIGWGWIVRYMSLGRARMSAVMIAECVSVTALVTVLPVLWGSFAKDLLTVKEDVLGRANVWKMMLANASTSIPEELATMTKSTRCQWFRDATRIAAVKDIALQTVSVNASSASEERTVQKRKMLSAPTSAVTTVFAKSSKIIQRPNVHAQLVGPANPVANQICKSVRETVPVTVDVLMRSVVAIPDGLVQIVHS